MATKLWRFHLLPERRAIRVESATFTGGVILDRQDRILDAAPILQRHCVGFTLEHLQREAEFHGWVLHDTTPDEIIELRADDDRAKAEAILRALPDRGDVCILRAYTVATPHARPSLSLVQPSKPKSIAREGTHG